MGRPVYADLPQLLCGLAGHSSVALHDPAGDLLIAFPGGILDDNALLGLGCLGSRHTHAVIVVYILDGHRCTLGGNAVKAGLAAALGHVDDGLLLQLVGGPSHTPAMVAVCGGKEGGLSEVPAERLAGQVVIGHL